MKQLFLTILVMLIFNSTYAQVKATSAEINTGTDDDKFATALALQGSKYLDQNGIKISAVTAAGANTYIANIVPAITAYNSGQVFYIKITTANTGASTLNLNGLGAKALVKDAGTALVAGDLLANKIYAVSFDGTNFQVLNVTGPQVLSLGITAGNIVISTGNNVTLTSIGNTNKPDANNALNAGFYTYTNTSNSTNYPAVLGGGLLFNRAGGTALGQFEFWKSSDNNESIFFRTGSGVSTFNPWRIIADRDWATSQFAPISVTTTTPQLLSPVPRYSWTHDMLPNDYPLGIQSSFAQQAAPGGWQNFGSLMTMKTYSSGGGTLQLYTPYGTAYGGNNLQVRFGNYNVNSGNSWTGWKTLMNQGDNAASATKLITPRTINGVSFDGSANITIDAATQASVATLDANAVHKTGNETIAGVKLFSTSVGIGTTNVHSYKLAVGGGIIAESVKVKPQGQWPDYVFEKDYPILPLNELEKFVLKNKHLPNIPNAAEVKKDGIDVGEMNARLLQKIEELTLYLIDLKKENETLKDRMDRLEKNEK